jgi:hypothetical protein
MAVTIMATPESPKTSAVVVAKRVIPLKVVGKILTTPANVLLGRKQ